MEANIAEFANLVTISYGKTSVGKQSNLLVQTFLLILPA